MKNNKGPYAHDFNIISPTGIWLIPLTSLFIYLIIIVLDQLLVSNVIEKLGGWACFLMVFELEVIAVIFKLWQLYLCN